MLPMENQDHVPIFYMMTVNRSFLQLFSQINVIRPGLVGNWQYFGERYCEGHFNLQTGRGGKVFRTFDTRYRILMLLYFVYSFHEISKM